jgi:hypothetical protein
MKRDANFGAEANVVWRECADIMRAQLRELAEDAVKTVHGLVTNGEISAAIRPRAALSVLQSMGAMDEVRGDLALISRWPEGYESWAVLTSELRRGR